ncbi:MAG TPA: DUF4156 domain-containing protein [Dokdonella sp.]|uniref:DUF4156 domain-containing protein n=1 Tax=Dokdonella sp. TaxID=2291710 RepID=UPI0025BFC6EF|nr:DUF4156 domain-containing protein [Dokdonella sp.]MBX3691398.1 DUF4156 domain-containing protein [Dokdonella sp.]MCW5566734.1 DUF4156 domain-containing protein [Dokdonella sp.]HNR92221.1 DUF4156 domain-containing protein [Dokdonella sp.]
MKALFAAALVVPLAACSWGIKLDAAGSRVRVAWNDDVGACRNLGTITVSVLDKLGPVNRRNTKVNDELDIMARNEGASMGADTVKPLGAVVNGEQRWGAYQCGDHLRPPATQRPSSADGGAETFPIR